ncbi:DUF302 domain-containing protein [Aquimarina sp. RZ0]|nr:DUF302 domain-containing protein [Aquimarina sp. RZ0]
MLRLYLVKLYFMRYCLLLLLICTISNSCNQTAKDSSNGEQTELKEGMKDKIQQGLITKISTKSFEETYNALVEVITNNPNLKIIAQLDHQANAASVGLELNPTRIILFGNPRLGTPLMQNAQTTGLDLPQKILVWQDEQEKINISYNDPFYLQERHGISEKDEVLQKVSGALDKITNVAAGL